MSWFSPKLVVDDDELEWQLATVKWLLQEECIGDPTQAFSLALPDDAHFPPSRSRGHERATELFRDVRRHCGMEEWACNFEPGEDDSGTRPMGLGFVQSRSGVLGTFSVERNANLPTIRYQPNSLRNPELLVATLAHELAHYRMHTYASMPPGGEELEELATDLLAVFLGFGIFLANSAKTFEGFTSFDVQGWSTQRTGYLSERALVTALAITERLAGRDPMETAAPFLKSHLRTDLKKADAHLRKSYPDMLAAIRAADVDAFDR